MKVLFLGTPEFAVPTLEALAGAAARAAGFELVAALCQPDRPAGRGGQLRAPAVKLAAQRLGLPVYQPERIKSEAAWEWLQQHPADVMVVVAYGQIIPQRVFSLPRWGAVNAHASLLPRYRGAAPIQWAIANGERTTGVTTMQIDAGLDTGDMLLRGELAIGETETAEELSPRLARLAAELTLATLDALRDGSVVPEPQQDSEASLARLLTKDDGWADWRLPAQTLFNRWRGFQPWPGLFTSFRGKQLKLTRVAAPPAGTIDALPAGTPAHTEPADAPPGTLLAADADAVDVRCGAGRLRLLEVQPEGKQRMPAEAFVRGARPRFGEERLGDQAHPDTGPAR